MCTSLWKSLARPRVHSSAWAAKKRRPRPAELQRRLRALARPDQVEGCTPRYLWGRRVRNAVRQDEIGRSRSPDLRAEPIVHGWWRLRPGDVARVLRRG